VSVAGLVVAGGAGERMLRSGSTVPKPLVRVRGVTLLERNVFALLRAGITDIHLAVSAKADTVLKFAQSRCHEIAETLGARLSVIAEVQPLGSIGPAAFLRDRDAVLIVNADNLTSLDLRAILAAHKENDAALTLAVHNQPFPIPFGEVRIEADRVVAYREKPTVVVPICSAVSVLGTPALASVQPGENVGLPALTNRLLSVGAKVRAFHHNAPWIDVNDLAAVEHAEVLVAAHAEEFELWAGQPDHETVAVIFSSSRGVVLEQVDDGTWCLPTMGIGGGENPLSIVAHIIEDRFGVLTACPNPLVVFDDIDTIKGGITRTHVFSVDVIDGAPAILASWIQPEDVGTLNEVAPLVLRAVAAWARD
jgi:NDP-sugar pyrophosphorylase family protein